MNLLVLDTSTDRAAIGLATKAGQVWLAHTEAGRRHGRDLIPAIGELLSQGGLAPREIDVVGVGLGPGSYTGLRVGVMAAKALAYATGSALVGLDSLEAVARSAPSSALHIAVLADAQRGQVYVSDFARRSPGEPLTVGRGCRIESLIAWQAELQAGTLVMGPGLAVPRIRAAVPPELIADNLTLDAPDAHRLLELAYDVWAAGRRDNPWLLEPRYLRRSAAEEQWDARNEPAPD